MKPNISNKIVILAAILLLISESASAYWVWTPRTKKFVNPKYAVKDSPKEQFDWAMSLFNAKDYQKAANEFDKLTKQYEYSEYASKAQFYVGLCYEELRKFYIAFQNYQKAIDNYPHIDNIDEIIEKEYEIANLYAVKDNPKLLGADIMAPTDRAVEIYKKVVDNAPYGKLADSALYNMGESLKKAERYDEAIEAFQRLVDEYPESKLYDKAKYEVAQCAYNSSLKPAYASEPTDKAIRAFEDFARSSADDKMAAQAEKTIQRLRDKAAEKSFMIAKFYEARKQYESAIIYYNEVVEKYPLSTLAKEAASRIEALKDRQNKKAKKVKK
ncbi:MAG: tetratricopeptide repeat protein [Candidatus Omnitrophica bacterium]|nr:tetratricopeptide repeat protein [Candidatus Omnitrophota bacterium]